jgi:actin-like ATPase involved in cell morphogenesis
MTRIKESTAIGLDVGTSRVVVARNTSEGYQFESQLNAFVDIPYSKMTEGVLKKENVPFSTENSHIVVHGNDAERFADLLNTEIRRPMNKGVLNAGEPDNLKLIEVIVSSLAGKASPGQKLCFTVPAAPLGSGENVSYHETSLQQILSRLGYEVESVNEGLAVIYSELEDSNYTGIGISCGGGLCNVCLSYLSVPVTSFSIAKAGDYIDSSAASVTGERANRIRIVKEESFHLNGHFSDKIQQVLGVYYDDMIRSLVTGLKEAFTGTRTLPKLGRPIPLVLSGGTALPQGFRDRFEKLLKDSDFPIPLSEIRMAADPLSTSAKGALVAALSDM